MTHDHHQAFFGYQGCSCFCEVCWDPNQEKCVCPSCICGKKLVPLPRSEEEAPPKAEHVCESCGDQVYRNGTRGRYPKYCESCKNK